MTTLHRLLLLAFAALLAAIAGGCASAQNPASLFQTVQALQVTSQATGEELKARG